MPQFIKDQPFGTNGTFYDGYNLMENVKIKPDVNRPSKDEAYMQMAEVWAGQSKANRTKVGAVLVKGKQIISDGYNGMPPDSIDDVCEYIGENGELVTKEAVRHAEENALLKLLEHANVRAQNATMYVTLSPCEDCAKLMKHHGIKRVVYRTQYRLTDGIDLLKRYNIIVDQLTNYTEN